MPRSVPLVLAAFFASSAVAAAAPIAEDEPTPPGAAAEPAPPGADAATARLELPKKYSLGARVRYIFVPAAFLSPYLDAATSTNQASLGLEFIYRKATYDVVTSLDFSFASPDDGNYLAAGHSAADDTHYTQFRDLNFLSLDVSIIGHHTWASVPWLELRYGAGLGLGVVLGDVLLTNDGPQCTTANASDTSRCYPVGIPLNQKDSEAKLKATESSSAVDTATSPRRHVSQDKPPVMAVLNVLIGVSFKLHHHVTAQVEVGFRDAMFVGAGAHYWF